MSEVVKRPDRGSVFVIRRQVHQQHKLSHLLPPFVIEYEWGIYHRLESCGYFEEEQWDD
jgi:hypothetical protein